MVQVPKVSAVLPVTTASATRGAPSVRVASVSAATVEEPHFSTAIQLDTAPFNFDEDRSRTDDRDPQQPQYHERRHLGLIEAPSQAFAALREYDNGTGRSAHGREGESRVFPGLVAKAINTYETNERVIHGNNPVLGTEVSVTLASMRPTTFMPRTVTTWRSSASMRWAALRSAVRLISWPLPIMTMNRRRLVRLSCSSA